MSTTGRATDSPPEPQQIVLTIETRQKGQYGKYMENPESLTKSGKSLVFAFYGTWGTDAQAQTAVPPWGRAWFGARGDSRGDSFSQDTLQVYRHPTGIQTPYKY